MLRQIKLVVSCQLSVIRKEIFFCLLSAALLILTFPKFNLEFLAWVGFVPLFFALEGKSKGKAFLLGFFTGIIFWTGIIYWLVHVTLLGTILLILYLALYFGFFGLTISSLVPRPSSLVIILVPCLWVLLEYLRSHLLTGFPWALLGYSQYLNLPVIQIADITGAWGVSFLVMLVNATIYWVTKTPRHQDTGIVKKIIPAALCLIIVTSYGYYKLNLTPNTYNLSPIKISVIQGNIPQELKWQPESRQYILDKYLYISRQAAQDNPDLIVWPEASSPQILGEEGFIFNDIFSFSRKIKIPLLIGTVTYNNEEYFNSAVLINGGMIINRYDKLHLVPFGEYIPLKNALPFLQTIVPIGDITAGKDYTIFKIPNSNTFSVLICFEDLFPELSRKFVQKGAGFLINITNDAWYKKTDAAYQHFQASVFRAVENRVFLVRSANTGVSGFIAPSGRIVSLVQDASRRQIFVDGYKTQSITPNKTNLSFYTRYGDLFILACFLFVMYVIIRILKIAQKNNVGNYSNSKAQIPNSK